MDTILQTPVAQADDIIKIELLLTEAIVFFQSIQNLEDHGLENTADVTNELQSKITEARANAKKGIKAQKVKLTKKKRTNQLISFLTQWNTVCLELPHSSLKMVANSMVLHLKRLDRHVPALAIASAINERLTDLMSGARLLDSVTSGNAQRFHMFSEAVRRQTFEQWPHMDYKWALPDQMAQAGFYHQPSVTGDDRAMCFTCSVCLVCWEKTDEPWSEHERHSPGCPFVKGEYTQNVPLAITYATSPALKNPPDANSEFTIVSNGNQGNLICTGSKSGQITIWNIERQLKSCHVFQISEEDKLIGSKLSHISVDFNINLDAICTYKVDDCLGAASSLANQKSISMSLKNKMIGTKIVCGISVPGFVSNEQISKDLNENSNMVIEMNIQNQALNLQHGVPLQQIRDDSVVDNSNIYLIVYEIVDASADKSGPISIKTLPNSKTEQNENKQKQLITNNSSDAKKSSVKNIVPEDRYDDVYMKFLPTEIDTMYENWKIGDLHDNLYVNSSKLSDIDFKGFFTDSDHVDDEKDKQNKNTTKNDVDSVATNLLKFENSTGNEITCKAVQCISIAPYNSYEITDIIPTCDKKFLLIVLRNTTVHVKDETAMEINDDEELECSKRVKLILYAIKDDGFINEIPVCSRLLDESDTPLEFCMLPTYDNNGRNVGEQTHSGVFVMVCADGSLKMITVTTLKTVSEAKIDNEKFVSAIYCKSLERLCGCTETGSLHFYSFYDLDADSGDDREEDVIYVPADDNSMIFGDQEMLEIEETHHEIPICDNMSTSSQSNLPSTPSQNITVLAYKTDVSLGDLKLLHTLTQFDEMLTPYSAEVPGCWSELVQAHKQRRHPQHMRPGDDMHLTKTWRLHNDA